MEKDIIEPITWNQRGMLIRQIEKLGSPDNPRIAWFDDSWKNLTGKPVGEINWTAYHLEAWLDPRQANLSKTAASAIITALSKDNEEGAKAILRNAGCPLRDSVTSA